jgi:hypothetical protein
MNLVAPVFHLGRPLTRQTLPGAALRRRRRQGDTAGQQNERSGQQARADVAMREVPSRPFSFELKIVFLIHVGTSESVPPRDSRTATRKVIEF